MATEMDNKYYSLAALSPTCLHGVFTHKVYKHLEHTKSTKGKDRAFIAQTGEAGPAAGPLQAKG